MTKAVDQNCLVNERKKNLRTKKVDKTILVKESKETKPNG